MTTKYEDGTNYVKYAREIARLTWDWNKRQGALDAADALQDAIKSFERTWSLDDMRKTVGAFTRCFQAVERIVPGDGGFDPVGGRLPLLKLDKVA